MSDEITQEMQQAWAHYASPNFPTLVGMDAAGCARALREAFLAGWKAAEMPRTVPAHSPGFDDSDERRQRFIADWNATVQHVGTFAHKYSLPAPDMLFQPKWLNLMRNYAHATISDTIINHGVRCRFGTWERADFFKGL